MKRIDLQPFGKAEDISLSTIRYKGKIILLYVRKDCFWDNAVYKKPVHGIIIRNRFREELEELNSKTKQHISDLCNRNRFANAIVKKSFKLRIVNQEVFNEIRSIYVKYKTTNNHNSEHMLAEMRNAVYALSNSNKAHNQSISLSLDSAKQAYSRYDSHTWLSHMDIFAQEIFCYYETYGYKATCEKFYLTPSKTLKNILSANTCSRNKTKQGSYRKIEFREYTTPQRLMKQYGISKQTASKALQRFEKSGTGYFFISKNTTDTKKPLYRGFNAYAVIETLSVNYNFTLLNESKTFSKYGTVVVDNKVLRVRISNHAFDLSNTKSLGRDLDINIDPTTYREACEIFPCLKDLFDIT